MAPNPHPSRPPPKLLVYNPSTSNMIPTPVYSTVSAENADNYSPLHNFSSSLPPSSDTLSQPSYDLSESRILCALALVVGNGPLLLSRSFCHTLATVYTTPLTNPTNSALTLPTVTGASKKMSPLMAMGSLFSAPTMLYVVDEVTRTHQALA